MSVFRKRNRIVSFRVSDQEFATLQHVSESHGARSISDYARVVACRVLEEQCGKDALACQVRTLSNHVDELRREVSRLAALVGRDYEAGPL